MTVWVVTSVADYGYDGRETTVRKVFQSGYDADKFCAEKNANNMRKHDEHYTAEIFEVEMEF